VQNSTPKVWHLDREIETDILMNYYELPYAAMSRNRAKQLYLAEARKCDDFGCVTFDFEVTLVRCELFLPYLFTSLFTYSLAYVISLFICLLTCFLTCFLSYLLSYLLVSLFAYLLTYLLS
jgi:hypothetical protein